MVLDTALLKTKYYKVRIKGKVVQPRECCNPSPNPWCCSYRKESLRVTLNYSCQIYWLISQEQLSLFFSHVCIYFYRKLDKISSNNFFGKRIGCQKSKCIIMSVRQKCFSFTHTFTRKLKSCWNHINPLVVMLSTMIIILGNYSISCNKFYVAKSFECHIFHLSQVSSDF